MVFLKVFETQKIAIQLGLCRVTPPCTNTRGRKVVSPGKKSAKKCSAMGMGLGGFWLKKELMNFMFHVFFFSKFNMVYDYMIYRT